MREIKFRGRQIDNGEWVYGYLVIDPAGNYRIYWKPFKEATSNTYHFVDSATVGQYTGLKDKNGREIYEGDIVNSWAGLSDTYIRVVIWRECGLEFDPITGYNLCKANEHLFEIIGNIFENPNLLQP